MSGAAFMDALREALADLEHDRWSRWQRYLHSKCVRSADCSLTIPAGYVAALERLAATDYADLSEEQKDSDRKEADNALAVILKVQADAIQAAREPMRSI